MHLEAVWSFQFLLLEFVRQNYNAQAIISQGWGMTLLCALPTQVLVTLVVFQCNVETNTILGLLKAPSIVSFYPFRQLFLWSWVPSSPTYELITSQLNTKNSLHYSRVFLYAVSSPVLQTLPSLVCLDSHLISSILLVCWTPPGFFLLVPPPDKAIFQGIGKLTLFVSHTTGILILNCLMPSLLKIVSYIFPFFICFRFEGKSGPGYIILAWSRCRYLILVGI